jgi:hypothetical protein
VNAVLYLARDTIDGGEQTGFIVIGPEQGDLGELCQARSISIAASRTPL